MIDLTKHEVLGRYYENGKKLVYNLRLDEADQRYIFTLVGNDSHGYSGHYRIPEEAIEDFLSVSGNTVSITRK